MSKLTLEGDKSREQDIFDVSDIRKKCRREVALVILPVHTQTRKTQTKKSTKATKMQCPG